LILTKLRQWFFSQNSKNIRDCDDIAFLIYWLASQEWKIVLDGYPGTSRRDILRYMRCYREALAEDAMLMETLRGVVSARDWVAMIN
jgi:hypothetical protein